MRGGMRSRYVTVCVLSVVGLIYLFRLRGTTGSQSSQSFTQSYASSKSVLPPPERDLSSSLIEFPLPRRNFEEFAKMPPHNINEPVKFAFATLLCTPEPDERDPFWAATQSIVWRILWSDWHSKYPMIVFVCPSTPKWQRTTLLGQGAIVKDIELIQDVLDVTQLHLGRWRDTLAKLNVWKSTEFKRIVFLDSDAFPVQQIDGIFDAVPEQDCNVDQLSPEDYETYKGPDGKELCRYTFGGAEMSDTDNKLNGGVLVLSPSLVWHKKLVRDARKTDLYDSRTSEQGLLDSSLGFGLEGPFKRITLSQIYNADKEAYMLRKQRPKDPDIKIIHCKMWSGLSLEWAPELNDKWSIDWMDQCRWYDSEVFAHARRTGHRKEYLELIGENEKR